ncbi:MAG: GspMb/PilO family protein, partial [Verrucomicrobiales bacterium]
RMAKAEAGIRQAETDLNRSLIVLEKAEELESEIVFLERAEGEPVAYQVAQAALQDAVKKEADRRGLETLGENMLSRVEGKHYHRVGVRYKVSGRDQKLQQWILAIHQPRTLQVVTKMEMKPRSSEPTQAECEVEVEKWFVPAE